MGRFFGRSSGWYGARPLPLNGGHWVPTKTQKEEGEKRKKKRQDLRVSTWLLEIVYFFYFFLMRYATILSWFFLKTFYILTCRSISVSHTCLALEFESFTFCWFAWSSFVSALTRGRPTWWCHICRRSKVHDLWIEFGACSSSVTCSRPRRSL